MSVYWRTPSYQLVYSLVKWAFWFKPVLSSSSSLERMRVCDWDVTSGEGVACILRCWGSQRNSAQPSHLSAFIATLF